MIRFGDFSDAFKGDYRYKKFAIYLHSAVEPFRLGLVSTGTTILAEDRSFDALVNNSGDAWIGTHAGLNFYFNDNNKLAMFSIQVASQKKLSTR
jgi:hypothetical protein